MSQESVRARAERAYAKLAAYGYEGEPEPAIQFIQDEMYALGEDLLQSLSPDKRQVALDVMFGRR